MSEPKGYIKKHYKSFLLFFGICVVFLSLGFNMIILPWYDKQQLKAKEKELTPLETPLYGIMPAAVTYSWEFDVANGQYPNLMRLGTSQYYLFAGRCSQGGTAGVWAVTLKIWSDNGTFYKTVIDSLRFADGYCTGLVNVYDDIYAIVYGPTSVIKTFSADDADGSIGAAAIDSLTLKYTEGLIDVTKVSGNMFAVAYSNATTYNSGWLESVYINNNGIIPATRNDSVKFNSTYARYLNMESVDSDTVAIAFSGNGDDGYVVTFDINPTTGDITNTKDDEWEYDTTNGLTPDIKKVSGNVYAISYCDANSDTSVKTLTISPSGIITKSFIDTLVVNVGTDLYQTRGLFIVNDGSVWGCTYRDATNDGWIKTFNLSSSGTIGNAIIDSLEFDPVDCNWWAPVVWINKSWYAICYAGIDYDGWGVTVQIDTNWASPTFSNPSPTNGSTGVALSPQTAITINDLNGDLMTVNFYENSTGSYVLRQTNNSCANGTYRWSFTQANAYSLKYYWKVYINDGMHNVSNWYCFTTQAPPPQERAWKSLLTQSGTGGNGTARFRSLFSLSGTGGNGTARFRQLLSLLGTGGNGTAKQRSLFSMSGSGGNDTVHQHSLFSLSGTGGNNTVKQKSIFSMSGTGGNVSSQVWNQLLSLSGTGGNIANLKSLFDLSGTGGDITDFASLFSSSGTGGNNTVKQNSMFSISGTGGNVSLDKLYITDVYPANGSTAAIKTSLTVTIEQVDGLAFNVSWYGSDDNGSSWFTLGSTINVHNGTWGVGFWNASILNKTYYWRIEVVDTDLNYANATYLFTTAAMSTTANQIQLLGQGNTPLAIMGGVLFVLPIGMLFMIMGKRKKQKEGNKKDDRTDDVFNP